MIIYNLERIYKARGIYKPFGFLKSIGFSDSGAAKFSKAKVSGMATPNLEKLCIALNCTPNDLMEWIPDKKQPLASSHPLYDLSQNRKTIDMSMIMQSASMETLKKIGDLVEKEMGKEEG